MHDVLGKLGQYGIVPVVAISRAEDAPRLGEALLEGGLGCAEITFRTQAAEAAIQALAQACPEVLVGAGTVLSIAQAERAVRAGAQFIVSPGFDANLVRWCQAQGVPITPGVATPTEITLALNHDVRIVKFFPAEAMGGVKTLKALSAPFGDVRFIPTGGVSAKNLADYLSLPAVFACGGSWLVERPLIDAGQFGEVTRLAREAVALVQRVRQGG